MRIHEDSAHGVPTGGWRSVNVHSSARWPKDRMSSFSRSNWRRTSGHLRSKISKPRFRMRPSACQLVATRPQAVVGSHSKTVTPHHPGWAPWHNQDKTTPALTAVHVFTNPCTRRSTHSTSSQNLSFLLSAEDTLRASCLVHVLFRAVRVMVSVVFSVKGARFSALGALPWVRSHSATSGHPNSAIPGPLWPSPCLLCQMAKLRQITDTSLLFPPGHTWARVLRPAFCTYCLGLLVTLDQCCNGILVFEQPSN